MDLAFGIERPWPEQRAAGYWIFQTLLFFRKYIFNNFPVTIGKLDWFSKVVGMYFVNVIFLPIGHRALSTVGWQNLQIVLLTRKKLPVYVHNATQTSLRNTPAVSQYKPSKCLRLRGRTFKNLKTGATFAGLDLSICFNKSWSFLWDHTFEVSKDFLTGFSHKCTPRVCVTATECFRRSSPNAFLLKVWHPRPLESWSIPSFLRSKARLEHRLPLNIMQILVNIFSLFFPFLLVFENGLRNLSLKLSIREARTIRPVNIKFYLWMSVGNCLLILFKVPQVHKTKILVKRSKVKKLKLFWFGTFNRVKSFLLRFPWFWKLLFLL